MPATFSKVKTVIAGETITASDRNAEFDNVLTNLDFSGLGDYSANTTEMQTVTDPYPADSESLATDGQGEIERLRYQIQQILKGLRGSSISNWYEDGPSADILVIDNDNTEVGINTTSPDGTLHVMTASVGSVTASTSADELTLEQTGGSGGMSILTDNDQEGNIFFGDPDDNDIGQIQYNHSLNSLEFIVNTALAMAIDSNGNLGIGIASADGPLHVHNATAGSVTAGAGADELTLENSVDVGMSFLSPNNRAASLYFGDPDDNDIGQIVYLHTSDRMDFYTNAGLRMTLDSGGELGIGITSPDGTLHAHTATAGSVTALGDANELVLENDGNCGISILSPNSNVARIVFGDPQDNDIGQITYTHTGDANTMSFIAGTTIGITIAPDGGVLLPNIPAADPSVAGELWNDSGTVKISAG